MRQLGIGLLFALAGIAAGAGGYTFLYADGVAYLFDNPDTCANCHVMREQLSSWQKSSHHQVATCNSCHTPHDLVGKYWTKLENGYHHSRAFTFQDWREPIRMRPASARIVLANCVACHAELVHLLPEELAKPEAPVNCITCHRDVGHAGR